MPDSELYCSRDPKRYFVLPTGLKLAVGPLQIRSPRGKGQRVDPGAAAAYEVDEARGAALEREIRADLAASGRALLEKLSSGGGALAELGRVAAALREGKAPGVADALAQEATEQAPSQATGLRAEQIFDALGLHPDEITRDPSVVWRVLGDWAVSATAFVSEQLDDAPGAKDRVDELREPFRRLGLDIGPVERALAGVREALDKGEAQAAASRAGAELDAARAKVRASLWSSQDGRFWLIPADEDLEEGELLITSLAGQRLSVSPASVEVYALSVSAGLALAGERLERTIDVAAQQFSNSALHDKNPDVAAQHVPLAERIRAAIDAAPGAPVAESVASAVSGLIAGLSARLGQGAGEEADAKKSMNEALNRLAGSLRESGAPEAAEAVDALVARLVAPQSE